MNRISKSSEILKNNNDIMNIIMTEKKIDKKTEHKIIELLQDTVEYGKNILDKYRNTNKFNDELNQTHNTVNNLFTIYLNNDNISKDTKSTIGKIQKNYNDYVDKIHMVRSKIPTSLHRIISTKPSPSVVGHTSLGGKRKTNKRKTNKRKTNKRKITE